MPELKPRTAAPSLSLATVDGGQWSLAEQSPEHFTMIVFYRGLHCPICKIYIRELDRLTGEFEQQGVSVVAISSDSQERAEQSKADWGIKNVPQAYGLSIEKAREWGLYISTSRGKTSTGMEEPAEFSEPGIFLIKPDGTLYWVNVQSMPFARPHFSDILKGVEMVLKMDYPARGEA